jgi:hypothetical protein
MSHLNDQAANSVNEMRDGKNSQGIDPHAREGEFLKRVRLRRVDLRTLHGTLRESARIYRELASGRISMAAAEIRSRVLRRHSEILNAIEQQDYLAELQRQVVELQRLEGHGALQRLEHGTNAEVGAT